MTKRKKWTPLKIDFDGHSWLWHLTARNGNYVAGASGYDRKSDATRAFKSAARLAAKALKQLEGK